MSGWQWLIVTLVFIVIQAFFSMMEMALVSFNKVRLQYWVEKGIRRAVWIQRLLQRPARLFGTTLLGVNVALQVGSQCSRDMYLAWNVAPDFAWLPQLFLVMIFAELAPLFAARRYAERVAMLGIPILYALSIVMMPIIWLVGVVSSFANWVVRGPKGPVLNVLSREELQHLVAAREPHPGDERGEEFNLLITNIFGFRKKVAREVMTPLQSLHMLPADATVEAVAHLLRAYDVPCVPIFFRSRRNVVGVAFARDLVKVAPETPIRQHARNPWFITQSTLLEQILKQFRYNNQSVAVILDHDGQTIGLLTLNDVLDELFGETPATLRPKPRRATRRRELVERRLPGSTKLLDFNREFKVHLQADGVDTLAQLIAKTLGHPPEPGDSIRVNGFEFTVADASLLGARTIEVRTVE